MKVIHIDNVNCDALHPYTSLTEAALRCGNKNMPPLFIAESPKVIQRALDAGYKPVSMLCEEKHITGDAADIIAKLPADFPIYTANRDLLMSITGYTLTRGVLCAMHRYEQPSVKEVLANATRIAVLCGVCDSTNIGAIFRSAAALGINAILLTRDSCDPLCRRAVRVSMGNIFAVEWTWIDDAIQTCAEFGFTSIALALRDNAVKLNIISPVEYPKTALLLGSEGHGLPDNVINNADISAIIPMTRSIDSLNVATAAAIAFYHFSTTN